MQAAQAYFACEKNEMLAANFLFENAESLREEMEEGAPAAHGEAPHGRPAAPPAPPSFPAPGVPGAAPPMPPVVEAKKEEKKEPEGKEEGTFLGTIKN